MICLMRMKRVVYAIQTSGDLDSVWIMGSDNVNVIPANRSLLLITQKGYIIVSNTISCTNVIRTLLFLHTFRYYRGNQSLYSILLLNLCFSVELPRTEYTNTSDKLCLQFAN
jgi:hypothetical protein